jgi:hypothetical protein
MRYIALEETFSIPGLPERQPSLWPGLPLSQRHLADWARRLPDFTEYRLPEMDAAGINVQVLSLTGPACRPTSTRRPRAMTEGLPQAIVDASLGRQVIHRQAEPADIAGSVFLLAADEAGWITGQTIMANGGNAFGL